jgi:hypothetical protein
MDVMRGDDAVVEDVVDVGLGGKAAEGSGVVFRCGRLDGGDAETLVAAGETGSSGGDAGFGVSGDGGVAIDDQVAVRSDASGIDLGCEKRGRNKLNCGEESEHGSALQARAIGQTRGRGPKIRRMKN